MQPPRFGPAWRLGAVATLVVSLVSCGGDVSDAEQEATVAEPELAAEIVQLRRDQVLERIEVALENRGPREVVVKSLQVRARGFRMGGPIPKDSPIPADQVVNLPYSYGTVACSAGIEAPAVGRAVVTLRVRPDDGDRAQRVRFTATDPSGLLQSIADRACTIERLRSEVDLGFADEWRPEDTPNGVVLHGTLEAKLLTDEPRTITQTAGAIMYGIVPDDSVGPVADPLAQLTPEQPTASIPVRAYAARCDAHVIGEIKKPYEFLVWIASPGEEEVPITPAVGQATKDALRLACAF